jgi:hypothetical protein
MYSTYYTCSLPGRIHSEGREALVSRAITLVSRAIIYILGLFDTFVIHFHTTYFTRFTDLHRSISRIKKKTDFFCRSCFTY